MSRTSFSKNTIVYLVGGVVAAGGNILLAPMYLRLLSAEDYGVWAQFSLMLQFLQSIMGWGLLATMSRLSADPNTELRRRRIAAALKLVTALNVGLLFVILVISRQRFLEPFVDVQNMNLFLYAAISAALTAYPSILMGIYVAAGKALQYRSLSVVGFLLQAGVLAAFVTLFSANIRMAILAMIIAMSGYAAISVYELVRAARWSADRYDYKELFAFGAPVVLYTVAGQSTDFVTRYLLASHVSVVEFGSFSVGIIYASVLAMLASAVNLAWVPLFYRRAQEWIDSGVYQQFVDVITTFTAVCGMFLIIFSDELIDIYSGGKSSVDVSIVGTLIMSAWLSSAIWMGFSNPLFHQKKTKLIVGIMLLSIALCMPLSFFLVKQLGALGASLALFLNSLTLCVIAAVALQKLRIANLSHFRLITLLFYLLVITFPLESLLDEELLSLSNFAGRLSIFLLFVAISVIPVWKSATSALKIIESDTSI